MITDILTLQLPPGNEKGSKKDRNRIIDFINGSEFSSEPIPDIKLANIDTMLANKSSEQLSISKTRRVSTTTQCLSFPTGGNHLSTTL